MSYKAVRVQAQILCVPYRICLIKFHVDASFHHKGEIMTPTFCYKSFEGGHYLSSPNTYLDWEYRHCRHCNKLEVAEIGPYFFGMLLKDSLRSKKHI